MFSNSVTSFAGGDAVLDHASVNSEQSRDQLERILASEEFRASRRLTTMLRYLVNQVLAGRGKQLKAYTIAVEAFGCDADFDPQTNPLVRIHAAKLRRALERYYFTEGAQDPVRIDLPKGHYAVRFSPRAASPAQSTVEPPMTRPSIAVLPLVNCSSAEGMDDLAGGLTEELVVGLSRFQDLTVITYPSILRHPQRPHDQKPLHQDLNAGFLLSGSIRQARKTIRVSLELSEAASGIVLWAERFDRILSTRDPFALESEICQRVVAQIAGGYGVIGRTLQREQREGKTSMLTAFEASLAFYHHQNVLSPETHVQALAQLQRVVEEDPNDAVAWAMLAEMYVDAYYWQLPGIERPLDHMMEAARRALALDPQNQYAQCEMAWVNFFRRDLNACIAEAERTVARNPNATHWVGEAGYLMVLAGDWERGLRIINEAKKLNPYHPGWFNFVSYLDHFRRDEYEQALAEAQAFNMPENRKDPILRAAALGQLGRRHEARATVAELSRLETGFGNDPIDFISRFIVCDELRERVIDGLRKAGVGA